MCENSGRGSRAMAPLDFTLGAEWLSHLRIAPRRNLHFCRSFLGRRVWQGGQLCDAREAKLFFRPLSSFDQVSSPSPLTCRWLPVSRRVTCVRRPRHVCEHALANCGAPSRKQRKQNGSEFPKPSLPLKSFGS
jgi:hypothetical protein